MPYILAPCTSLHKTDGVSYGKSNFDKCKISHRLKEGMLFAMVKACLCFKIFLLVRTLKEFFVHIYGFKQNETHSSSY